MHRKYYTNEQLVSNLQRFYNENNRTPTRLDMQVKFGYPSSGAYVNRFGSWNNALKVAGLKVNQKHQTGILDGNEICAYCGCTISETSHWFYINKKRYCVKHGNSGRGGTPDYVKGELDINSNVGIGRAGEILVTKVLNIGKENDCNRVSCGYSFDLYNEEYGKIDVKTSLLNNINNNWTFSFKKKKEANTYICLGLSYDRSIVKHVWIIPNKNIILNTTGIMIYNITVSLQNREYWEVNSKPYNDIWMTMTLKGCKSMVDKNK